MSVFRWLALASVVCLVACGDEAQNPLSPTPATGAGGGGGTASAGGGGTNPGGGPPVACGEGITAEDVEAGAWDDRFSIAGVASRFGIAPYVYDFAADVDGTLVAAGRFDTHDGAEVAPLLRWKNGAWEPARTSWEIGPPEDGFSAVAISPTGAMALATNDSFGIREGEIWIDEGSGLASIGAFEGQVRSLAYFDGKLWVAGLFSLDDGGSVVDNLAVWDGSWSAPPGGAVDGPVYELLVADGTLYVGGAFTTLGGVAAANVAAYDGTTVTPYDLPGALAVYALARTDGGELYLGGAFGDFREPSGIAHWTGAGWEVVGGGLGQFATRGVVADIVAHGETVDVTGCFNSAGGLDGAPGAVASRSLARWDGTSWQALDDGAEGVASPWFVPLVCGDEGPAAIWDATHQRLAYHDQRLVAGGGFPGAGGVQSQSLIAHDATGWTAQGAAGLGFGGSLEKIAAGGPGCSVYGVGSFSHVAGTPATGRVVHYDGDSWKSLADDLPRDAWCAALDVDDAGEVAVGCMVFPPNGDAEGVVLQREGDQMIALEAPGPVMSLAFSPSGALFVGGAPGYLARLEGDAFTVIESGFDAPVQFIAVSADDDVVVAGSFSQVGPTAASRVARWDGSAWSALGEGLPGAASALARDGATIYASCYDEGQGAYLLGAFDGTSWSELATPAAGLTPKPEFSFNALEVVEGGIIAVGSAQLDDESGRGALLFRDGAFLAIRGGVEAIGVTDVAVASDALWIAGSITAAGDGLSSVGVARLGLAP